MKYTTLIGMIGLSIILAACQSKQHKTELKTLQDSVSYSIGMDIGKNLKGQMIDVNPDALAQALKDLNGDGKPMLTDAQARSAMMAFQTQMMATHAEKMKAAGEKNKKDGEVFLAQKAESYRQGHTELPRRVDRRNGIRQLIQKRRACRVSGQRHY
jgi:FKBP-type peptidyl-prolyl cis-trans isomerase FklB